MLYMIYICYITTNESKRKQNRSTRKQTLEKQATARTHAKASKSKHKPM